MNRYLKTLAFLFAISTVFPAGAQYFRLSAGLLANANVADYRFDKRSGNFSMQDLHVNGGIAADVAYFFDTDPKLFLSTGLRIFNSRSSISDQHTVPGVFSPVLTWKFSFTQLAIPLHLGISLRPFSNGRFFLDIFGGGSIGLLQATTFYTHMSAQKSRDDYDMVGAEANGGRATQAGQTKVVPSVDLGVRFSPIASFPRLNIGILLSRNLSASPSVEADGLVANANKGLTQDFSFSMHNKFTNVLISLNYSIGKKWSDNLPASGNPTERRYNAPVP